MKIRIELEDRELRVGKEQLIALIIIVFGLMYLLDSWADAFFLCLIGAASWLGWTSMTTVRRRKTSEPQKPASTIQSVRPTAAPTAPAIPLPASFIPAQSAAATAAPPANASDKKAALQHAFLVAKAEVREEFKSLLQELKMDEEAQFADDDEDEDEDDEEESPKENANESELLVRMRRDELISALKNLGYKQTSTAIADHVMTQNPGADLETLVRAALQFARKK